MNIVLYDPPKEVHRKNLYSTYPDGIGLYFQKADDDTFLVLAEETITKYTNTSLWILKKLPSKYKSLEKAHRTIINPFARSNISPRPIRIVSKGIFWSSQIKAFFKTERSKYRDYYREECTKIKLYYKSDSLGEAIAIYGTSIAEEDDEKLYKRTHTELNSIAYKDYMRKFQEIQNETSLKSRKTQSLPIIKGIQEWMSHVSFREFEKDIAQRVIGQSELSKVLAGIYCYFLNLSKGKQNMYNILIIAPSGCGKTETYRAIRDYFKTHIRDLPISQVDLTQITTEGFKGKDTNWIVKHLLEHKETNGVGIVFLDEFDKKIHPTYTAHSENINLTIQGQLLTMIEGSIIYEEVNKSSSVSINTENTLFIALGSFNEIRRQKGELAKRQINGFGQEVQGKAQLHYTPITREEIIELGGSYELLGRFPVMVNYQQLSKEAVNLIINKMLREIGQAMNIHVELSKTFREKLIASADTGYGCRKFTSLIMEALLPMYAESLRRGDSQKCKIVIESETTSHLRETDSHE